MALKITKVNMPVNKYDIKCPYMMTPKGVCVHNTANKASAMNEVSYMISNNYYVSYHFAVDYERAVQGVDLNRNTWHCGDGTSGWGNRNLIAVEICHSTGDINDFLASEKNGAVLVAMLLKQYGWTIKDVYRHQDFANKYCPHKTMDLGWQRFLDMVQAELDGTTPTPTPQPKPQPSEYHYDPDAKLSVKGAIKGGQSEGNKFCDTNYAVDGIVGTDTQRLKGQVLQHAMNIDYVAGLDEDGVIGTRSKKALAYHTVRIGEIQSMVKALQILLLLNGYNPHGVDSIFGSGTEKATEQFQADTGLTVDGIAGRNTFLELVK